MASLIVNILVYFGCDQPTTASLMLIRRCVSMGRQLLVTEVIEWAGQVLEQTNFLESIGEPSHVPVHTVYIQDF